MRLLIILLTVVVMTVTGCGSSDVNGSSTAGNSVEVTTGSSQETQATTQAQVQTTNVGDKISLGTYYDKQIEWTVLAKENGKTLIITADAIDLMQYNNVRVDVTWEKCTLRNWLNNDFYNAAFSASEKARIADTNVVAEKNPMYDTDPGNNTVDKVFLLSINEVNKYFPNDTARMCNFTTYGRHMVGVMWWSRTPSDDNLSVACVNPEGSVSYTGSNVDSARFVRPALWINQ